MKSWKAVAAGVLAAGLLLVAGCEKKKEAPKPPPPDPLSAFRNELKNTSEKMIKDRCDILND